MIAVIGQSTLDRVRDPAGTVRERLGGSPLYAATALAAVGADAVILTRGGTAELRAPLAGFGFEVVAADGTATFTSEIELLATGERRHAIAALGDPFLPADVRGWMAPHLASAAVVVCGAQWRADFPPETLRLLAKRHLVLLDAQGPVRPARLGPVVPSGPLDSASLAGVGVLKCSEDEAAACAGCGVGVLVVTRGARGATVIEAGRTVDVPGDAVEGLADTVGAGDMFLALLGAALSVGRDVVDATASACAGVTRLLRCRLDSGA